ncbi:peroxisome proliferator-activated receptor gamma coactivator-related protein 1 isoform X1 [Pungitius pungitius]|uniref:peroxisome proliferator-activated receptor gamma coactivator-related protein 1 isoform X1 n=1 Tax=Pungitius pungitius TaxID=134920 RepID=UPI002E118580
MAARWGAGEDTLTTCNMEYFSMDTLDEVDVLSSAETLEALQSCLDPSILSIFEDTPTIETKGVDEESEATLLTALTEILDNVDDENLSPFDTLPDSDLLSGQKGRELSPLRRLLCLSRSSPEKDTLYNPRHISTGKNLPLMLADFLQRSDGEEEEDGSSTLSPGGHDLSPDGDQLHWESLALPLPVTFEQQIEDGVSVNLGDLVRHIRPYCMDICMQNDEGEQMLPEGGILLEVVDQGENGEPILAIQGMDLSVALPLREHSSDNGWNVLDEAEEVASDSSEHIVVDDDDEDEAPLKVAGPLTPELCPFVKDNMMIKKQKEEIKGGCSSRRKRKKKCKELHPPSTVEGRVLRSGTVTKSSEQSLKKPEKTPVKKEKKHKVPKVPLVSTPVSSSVKHKKPNPCQTERQKRIASTTLLPETNVRVATLASTTQVLNTSREKSEPSCSPTVVISQQPLEAPAWPSPAPQELEDSSAAPSAVRPPPSSESSAAAASQAEPQLEPSLPPVALAVPEPKPKSLSLAEYRRLRQQKRPSPVEKQENCTKWPSLPELPKELPLIPCLPDPSPTDSRRPSLKPDEEEVRPAWQPGGPYAPPTPEALLVPPAYMAASSSRVTPAPKQQQPEPSKPPVSQTERNLPSPQLAAAQPAVPCVPQSSGSPASLKAAIEIVSSANSQGSLAPLGGKSRGDDRPASLASVQPTKICLKNNADTIKPNAALSLPSAPQKTVVLQKVPELTARVSFSNPITPETKSSKPTANGTQLYCSPVAHPSDSQSLKAKPVVLETKGKPTTAVKPLSAKSATQELIEAFTTEIGIEATDLTSLLEQFEETQAKEEHCVQEVSGRAAAVGNSSEPAPEKTIVERVRANDLSSTAALTPPATPPHQMWKPLSSVVLLGKTKPAEVSKSNPAKVIQIEARPLPSVRSRSKPAPAAASVAPELACMDHDYCLPEKGTSTEEPGKRWNVKQPSFITIKPIGQPTRTPTQPTLAAPPSSAQSATNPVLTNKTQVFAMTEPLDHRTDKTERSSILETPDASPTRQDTDASVKDGSPRRRRFGRPYRQHAASSTASPKDRTGGRSRKRAHRSPSPSSCSSESNSDSSTSRSRSRSAKKRYRLSHSRSSSSSSSRSSSWSSPSVSRSPPRRRKYSYSSSRSGSWSRSRSRSQSPHRRAQWSRSRMLNSYGNGAKTNVEEVKRLKEKAIEERRVVYIGRIRGTMTQKELKERFSLFGEIEECTLHFRDHGDNYGFVTYYDTKNAFMAIENGGKLRKPDELPFDLCFGGRRQFCKSNYADLDSSREYDSSSAKGKFHTLDFDTLLKQAKQNQRR